MTWLWSLYRLWLDRHDPAWRPTGLKFTTARDYDQGRAEKGYQRSQQTSATGRRLYVPKKPSARPVASERFLRKVK